MRASLVESLGQQRGEVYFPAGSMFLCCSCYKPMFVLQHAIYAGESVGRSRWKLRPPTLADIAAIEQRVDQPVVSAMAKYWTHEDRVQHCQKIQSPAHDTKAICPSCQKQWTQIRAVEANEVINRDPVWEPIVLFPAQPMSLEMYRAWANPPQS